MKTRLLLILLGFVSLHLASATEEDRLKPDAKLSFDFPELPETFFARSTKKKQPATLSAQLPENYSLAGKFPLFVFLNGGNGGPGNATTARRVVGPRDFITVNLPLFKGASTEVPPLAKGLDLKAMGIDPSQIILPGDATELAAAYRVMLQKLYDTVPNIDFERSALGGFSNGAHATAALLGCKDASTLQHFGAFVLVDGGMSLGLTPEVFDDPVFKTRRILMLTGDSDADPKMQLARVLISEPLLNVAGQRCAANHIDFQRVIMQGYGHAFPSAYFNLVACWLRGEALPHVDPKPTTP